jgi:plastocyanin
MLLSCDSKPDQSPAVVAREIVGNGVIRGRVVFNGTPPPMKEIPNQPCHEGAPVLKEETVIVGTNSGLKNVLISIEGVGPGKPKADIPLLDQKECRYIPHVIAITAGQTMTIRSSDPTMHNVHVMAEKNEPLNLGMVTAGQEKQVKFEKPEIMHAKCDVHPWMSAYIGVFENPLFAVSGDDGEFEIKGVPAGSYKLVAWHEQFGRIEQPITVDEKTAVEVKVTYGK